MAILGSILGAVGSTIGGLLGIGSQAMSNSQNMKLAEYAFDRNKEMWELNNEYNSPSAQMERLKAAGLNPNLVYGSGSVTGNTSGSMPAYNAPTVHSLTNGGFVSDAVNRGLFTDAQLKNLNAQTKLSDSSADVQHAQVSKITADTARQLAETSKTKFELSLAKRLEQNSIDVAEANLQAVRESAELNKARTALNKAQLTLIPYQQKLTDAQYNQVLAATSKLWQDYNMQGWLNEQERSGAYIKGESFDSYIARQMDKKIRGEKNAIDTVIDMLGLPSNKGQYNYKGKSIYQSIKDYFFKPMEGSNIVK